MCVCVCVRERVCVCVCVCVWCQRWFWSAGSLVVYLRTHNLPVEILLVLSIGRNT